MNQRKALLGKKLLEQGADAALDDENGLVDLGPEIEGPVVQPCVQTDKRALIAFLFFALCRRLHGHGSLGIGYLEGQRDLSAGLDEQLLNMNLKVGNGRAFDGLLNTLDQTGYDEGALGADVTTELDHLLAELVAGCNNRLYGVEALAQVQESQLCRLDSGILYPASECNFLVLIAGNFSKVGAWGSGRLEVFGSDERKLAV